ncbi:MAG TPA: helix-turn-helix domain-containing protein [Roseateles sp.]
MFYGLRKVYMDFFSEALARLKHELRVSKDQEVAALLGLGKTAFSERKKRGSFPHKEVLALVDARPELGIDVNYVLTGSARTSPQGGDQAPQQPALAADEQVLIEAYRRCNPVARQQIIQTAALLSAGLGASSIPGAGMVNHGTNAVQVGQAGGKVTVKKGR